MQVISGLHESNLDEVIGKMWSCKYVRELVGEAEKNEKKLYVENSLEYFMKDKKIRDLKKQSKNINAFMENWNW